MAASSTVAARLDEARRQVRLNDTLKRAILDADDAAKRAHAQVALSKARSDAARQCQRAVEQLAEFEKLGSFAATRRFNPALLLEETGQQVSLDRLIKPGDVGSTDGLINVIDVTRRLQRLKGSVSGPNGSSALSTFYQQAITGFDKAVTLLRDTALDSNSWCRIPEGLFMLLEELAAVPFAADVVAENKERISRMEFECEELQHHQDQALADGDMKRMEELYFQRVTVQEAMVGAFDAVFRQLDAHIAESNTYPLKRVRDVHQSASGDVASIAHRSETLKQQVRDDLQRLNKSKEEVTAAAAERKKQAAQLREQSDLYLRNNLMQTEQCYAAMADLLKQINKLAADRTEALEARLRFVEEEDCYQADVTHFNSFYKQHLALLDSTLQTLEVSEEVTDLIDEVVCNGCNAVEQRARDNEAEIEAIRVEFHERRLKQFRQLYLTLGDLQYKKERNLEELEKKIEHTHIQQELAMETFNPKAKEYSEAKKALLAIREEMAAQVQVLADKAVLHIEAFKPTESALIQAGKDFIHPVHELDQMNQRRQQKLIEYNKLMSTESGGSRGDATDALDVPSEADIDEEKRRIEAERKQQEQRSQARFRQQRSQ